MQLKRATFTANFQWFLMVSALGWDQRRPNAMPKRRPRIRTCHVSQLIFFLKKTIFNTEIVMEAETRSMFWFTTSFLASHLAFSNPTRSALNMNNAFKWMGLTLKAVFQNFFTFTATLCVITLLFCSFVGSSEIYRHKEDCGGSKFEVTRFPRLSEYLCSDLHKVSHVN